MFIYLILQRVSAQAQWIMLMRLSFSFVDFYDDQIFWLQYYDNSFSEMIETPIIISKKKVTA